MANGRPRGSGLNAGWRKLTQEQIEALPNNHHDAVDYYFTGKECIRGHIGPRAKKSMSCVICNYDPDRKKFYNKRWEDKQKTIKQGRVITAFGITRVINNGAIS